MSEQIDIDINVNMNNADDVDELTAKLEAATAQVDELQEELANIELGTSDADFDEVSSALEDAEAEAEALQQQLEEIDNTTVEPEIHMDSSEVDATNEKLQETEESASSLTTALGGIAGVVGLDQMITTADNINTSWNRLQLTFQGTGVSVEELQTAAGQAAEATGRSGGQVRGYFNDMGIAGITNVNLLSSSFESLAGFAYQSGQSIEALEGKVQTMVMTGNAGERMLKNLGLTTEDLAAVMGVSADEVKEAFENLTPEERLQVITQAMGEGAEANEMYKNSYEGLKNQAINAMNGLMGAIGQGILPVLTPMIQGATSIVKGFTDVFKSLPGPVQAVVGGIGGFIAAGTALIGTLGVIGQVGKGVVDGLRSMKNAYSTVKDAMGTAKAMMDALRNSESITEGVRAALAAATGAEAAAEGGATAAKSAAIGPTTGLAIAENSLLWPLLLIVGAVVAVIAVMWYLYNTNETVRNGINWLVEQIQNFINSLMPVVDAIISFVTQGLQYLNTFPGGVWGILLAVLNFIATWQVQLVQFGVQAAIGFINSVRNGLAGLAGVVQSAVSGVFNFLTAPFRQAYDYIYNNVIKPLQDSWNWLSSAFNGFEGYGSYDGGYSGVTDTLNSSISTIANSSNTNNMTINNNFNGLVEESAAEYIVNAVNDRLRREKLLKGA